ncbi:hypothetical protein SLS60_004323 [Paraconiothyrium brasiliense]|uniref:O-methyltransferase C-terminal domain-containing protein n=1 Tax=Paraconiothyrium brasiliense TaxID=300254 RepID=A0ABR3RKU9_9PLEO
MTSNKPSRIVELSAAIQTHVQQIDEWYTAKNLPSPNFDEDYPDDLPAEIHQARNAVLIATDELNDLMLGPRQIAECLPPQHTALLGIQAVARWNVADHVAVDEEVSFNELAKRCNIPESDFTRILRQAISKHVFRESRKGFVVHNAASKLFISPSPLNDYIYIALEDIWQGAAHMLDAMEKWDCSQEPHHTGYNLAKGIQEPYFTAMKSNERQQRAFANNMSYMQTRHGFGSSLGHLISSFDWDSVKKVVDVGGGIGDTALEIVRNTKDTVCVVQDLPDVISQAKEKLTAEQQERVILMSHNFFESQPVDDADVFFLRWILHDWADEAAVKILRLLIPALKPGASIILQEFIVPGSGEVPSYFEKMIRCMDLAMKAAFNSKERTVDDWSSLFRAADERFKLADVQVGGGQGLAVLRFTWDSASQVPSESTSNEPSIGYPLENDEEISRLSNQHDVLKDEMGKLVLAPIDLSTPLRILDSATADGTWIRDLESSTAPVQHTFVGTDLDPTNFPSETSDNQTYHVQDINKPWPEEWKESFDYVHQRLVLNGAGRNQKVALSHLLALVKPGGWVQIMESTNDIPEENGPAMRNFDALMKGVFASVGSNIRLMDELPRWLEEEGFGHVQSRVVEMRLGRMNGNPQLARQGTYSSIVAARSLSEFAKTLPTDTIPLSEEQLNNLGSELNAELATRGGLYPLRVVWACKPSVAG